MKFGLTEDEFSLLSHLVIEPLKDTGCSVWIFGSRASGRNHQYSDIDLLYSPPPERPIPSGFISNLLESIEDSRLSYKVDLVSDGDLASSYRANVEKEKVRL